MNEQSTTEPTNEEVEARARKILAEEAHLDRLRVRAKEARVRFDKAKEERELARIQCADVAKDAAAAGIPETELKELFGVNRTTVRRWIGKG